MANEMPTGFPESPEKKDPSPLTTKEVLYHRHTDIAELERRAAELEAKPIHKKALVEAAKDNAKANALVEAAKAIERGQMEENHDKAQKSFRAASLWISLAKTISEHKP